MLVLLACELVLRALVRGFAVLAEAGVTVAGLLAAFLRAATFFAGVLLGVAARLAPVSLTADRLEADAELACAPTEAALGVSALLVVLG